MNPTHRQAKWPDWWQWEIEFTPHIERRMEDRDFTEVELREMLEKAMDYREDVVDGLENSAQAFIRMLNGENKGKQLVKVS